MLFGLCYQKVRGVRGGCGEVARTVLRAKVVKDSVFLLTHEFPPRDAQTDISEACCAYRVQIVGHHPEVEKQCVCVVVTWLHINDAAF